MSNASTPERYALERIVTEGIAEATALEIDLAAERKALETRDDAALGKAAESKRNRVARLESLERQRKAAGGPSTEPPEPRQWQQFLAIIGRCNAMNATNGAIIRLRREQISAALRVVNGSAQQTYGPSGTETGSRPGRALAAI
jgi:flagellar biosynthesis/type III secretory pathway chaperone